jgi:hypothetical protein
MKKGFFCFPELEEFHPSFCSTQNSADRQNEDIPSAMQLGSLHARVFHLRKKAFQILSVVLFHIVLSSFFDLFYHLFILVLLCMGLCRCDCPALWIVLVTWTVSPLVLVVLFRRVKALP